MEISIPTWNSSNSSYLFRILKSTQQIEQSLYYDSSTRIEFPADPAITKGFVQEFLEATKKYFTQPLTTEKVLRHLRQPADSINRPKESGWFTIVWKPYAFVIKTGDFALSWQIVEAKTVEPLIPADFTASETPRAQSPDIPEQTRNIQIHDSLIPVGDLPLSDLPPLSFATEAIDPSRELSKRRVREARLKVALAKLKAQRMEHKYYERYGQSLEDSEESSEFSTDSEGDVSFEESAER